MKKESQLSEGLRQLAGDVTETATYLGELGVEFLESVAVPSPNERPAEQREEQRPAVRREDVRRPPASSLPDALKRNARAEQSAKSPDATPPRTPAPPPAADANLSVLYQEAMPKKPVRAPSPDPPPPQETLFGEITPKDELSLGRPGETFEDIREDIGECVRCPLYEGRTKIVHTEGSAGGRLMFVGEAPGADEDASGRPFVGRAGQLLNKIIEAIGLKREDVLIGNVNRCRPPGNRAPTTEEAKTCKPFLLREIAAARPEVIVVLGNTAMRNLLDTREGITKVRGQFQDYKGLKVMPTFHPAYLLRDPSKKRETWDDMKKVRDYLNKTKPKE
jgi:DNA polymerase